MIVVWLTLAGLDTALPENIRNYWFVIGAAGLIGVLVLVLVYLGWGWKTARTGLIWGLVAGLGALQHREHFWGFASTAQHTLGVLDTHTYNSPMLDLFTTTLKDLALSQTGHANFLEVVSLVDEPSMRWILRGIEGVTFVLSIGEDENPQVIIARDGDSVGSRQTYYRGQDFGWWESPGWGGALPWEPMRWVINREGATITEKVVLWARVDLFPEEPEAIDESVLDDRKSEKSSPSLDEGVEQ